MNDYVIKKARLLESDRIGRKTIEAGSMQVATLRGLFDKNGAFYGVLYTTTGNDTFMVPAANISDTVVESKRASSRNSRGVKASPGTG
jgi:hypothetical protein